MKRETKVALARNKFLRDWKKLRDQLMTRFGLPVEISENSFDSSVALAERVLAQIKQLPPEIDNRCSEREFQEQAAKVFDKLGRQSWLVLSHWKHIGAIRVASVALEAKAMDLLHFGGDTIFGCDEEEKFLFLFDFDPDYGSDAEYNVVLTSWSPN
jgi:hypothetical protein